MLWYVKQLHCTSIQLQTHKQILNKKITTDNKNKLTHPHYSVSQLRHNTGQDLMMDWVCIGMELDFQEHGCEYHPQSCKKCWMQIFLTGQTHMGEVTLSLPPTNLSRPSSQQQDHEGPVLRTQDYYCLWRLKTQTTKLYSTAIYAVLLQR